MGQLFQENDQDEHAILSFRAAHEADPYDLDSLLCLGVSCTNELDDREACKHLQDWLKYHPDFSMLPGVQDTEMNLEDILRTYEVAHSKMPGDTNVLLALGVLQFIKREYDNAAVCFGKAIKENPTEHNLWNKYGAALSNNMKPQEAIEAYQ